MLTRRNIFEIVLILCLFVPTTSTLAQQSEGLEEISSILQTAVDKNEVVGHAALIYQRGKIVYRKRFGLADRRTISR